MNKSKPLQSFFLVRNCNLSKPIFLTSPHSGNIYDYDFLLNSNVPVDELRRNEDMFVDELLEGALDENFPLLSARYPRIFIDLNRGRFEIDKTMFYDEEINFNIDKTKYTRSGIGLIPKISVNGEKIYKKKLIWSEIDKRINTFYDPWHLKLKESLFELNNNYESSLLIDCHSMPSNLGLYKNNIPEIIISNNFEKGESLKIANLMMKSFSDLGFTVSLNEHFYGGYITQYYNKLKKGISVIQLEIRRDLYMNENKLIKNSNFSKIQNILKNIIVELSDFILDNEIRYKAAE